MKNGVICLVIVSTPRVNGYENVKNGSLFVFSADDFKKPITVWAKYLSSSERSYLDRSEMLCITGFGATITGTSTLENTRFLYFLLTQLLT